MFVSCKTAKSNISCFLRVSGRWLVSKMMPAKYMLEVSQVIINSEPLIIGLVGNKQVCFLVTYNEQKRKIATFSFSRVEPKNLWLFLCTQKAYSCQSLPFLSTFSFLRVNEHLDKKIHPSGRCHINTTLTNMDYNQIIWEKYAFWMRRFTPT